MAIDYQDNNGPKGFIEMLNKLTRHLSGVPKFSNKAIIDRTQKTHKPPLIKPSIEYTNTRQYSRFDTPTTSKALDNVYELPIEVYFLKIIKDLKNLILVFLKVLS